MLASRATSTILVVTGLSLALSVAPAALAAAPNTPIAIDVDLRDAPRNLVHAKLTIPATPGTLTLAFPKWIPGEHGPSGPIRDLAAMRFRAGGSDTRNELAWQRDPLDMYAFRLEVPAGADAVEATLDYLAPAAVGSFTAGRSTTAALAVLSWNTVVLYPQGASPERLWFAPSVTLPAGWSFATALEGIAAAGTVRFPPVSRPLADTATAAQSLFGSPSYWRSWRRGTDFYDESVLIWMEVDAKLRAGSQGSTTSATASTVARRTDRRCGPTASTTWWRRSAASAPAIGGRCSRSACRARASTRRSRASRQLAGSSSSTTSRTRRSMTASGSTTTSTSATRSASTSTRTASCATCASARRRTRPASRPAPRCWRSTGSPGRRTACATP